MDAHISNRSTHPLFCSILQNFSSLKNIRWIMHLVPNPLMVSSGFRDFVSVSKHLNFGCQIRQHFFNGNFISRTCLVLVLNGRNKALLCGIFLLCCE